MFNNHVTIFGRPGRVNWSTYTTLLRLRSSSHCFVPIRRYVLQFTNHLKLNRFSKISYFRGEIFDIKITAQQKVCFAEIFDDV